MNRVTLLSFAALTASIGCVLATTAHSQIGAPKAPVVLQPSTPGTSQSGHANISGVMRAGQFAGGGAALTNLTAANLVGTVPDASLSANVARRDQPNTFNGGTNVFNGFVGIKRSAPVTFAESFGIGNNATGYDGMYIRTASNGLPFYGYSLGGAISAYHYIDSFDANKWKFYQGGTIGLTLDTSGRLGVNNTNPVAQLDVASTGAAANFVGFRDLGPVVEITNTAANGMCLSLKASGDSVDSQGTLYAESSSPYTFGAAIYAKGLPGVGGAALNVNRFFSAGVIGVYGSSALSAWNAAPSGAAMGIGCETGDPAGMGIYARSAGSGANVAVYANGNFVATGTKSFEIDHPLDPEHKTLKHFCAEGPEPYNVYRGNVTLDGTGAAWVELPRYFDAINADLSYQLTCVGGYAQVYVAEEVTNNRFKIAGGRPGLKVSWQVTGVRNDAYVRHHGFEAEVDKPASQQGFYLSPESYGLPSSRSMSETMKATKNPDGSVVIAGKYYSPSEAKRLKL